MHAEAARIIRPSMEHPEELKQCSGKKGYLTYEHAAWDAKQMRRKHIVCQVYHCRFCSYWHVGRASKEK